MGQRIIYHQPTVKKKKTKASRPLTDAQRKRLREALNKKS